MGSIREDLDKFLKTDGLRIMMGSNGTRVESYEPLTVNDIDDFGSMNLETLDKDGLKDLLDKAEELQDDLEDDEPEDEESEEHNLWEDRYSETEDFIDRIRDCLNELEDKESADAGFVVERIVWKNKTNRTGG